MAKRVNEEFKDAQALGQIVAQAEVPEKGVEGKAGEDFRGVGTPHEFQVTVARAQLEGTPFVEVTPELFKLLAQNTTDKSYITYGKPGIRVYVYGTREQTESEERMNAEDFYTMDIKRKNAGFVKDFMKG